MEYMKYRIKSLEENCIKYIQKKEDLAKYLKSKICSTLEPLYVSKKYIPIKDEQIKRLNEDEVQLYLEEQKMQKTK